MMEHSPEVREIPYGGPLGELRDAEIAVIVAEAALAGAKERLRRAKERCLACGVDTLPHDTEGNPL